MNLEHKRLSLSPDPLSLTPYPHKEFMNLDVETDLDFCGIIRDKD